MDSLRKSKRQEDKEPSRAGSWMFSKLTNRPNIHKGKSVASFLLEASGCSGSDVVCPLGSCPGGLVLNVLLLEWTLQKVRWALPIAELSSVPLDLQNNELNVPLFFTSYRHGVFYYSSSKQTNTGPARHPHPPSQQHLGRQLLPRGPE